MPRVSEFSDPIPSNASKAIVAEFAEKFAAGLEWKAGDFLEPLLHRIGGKTVCRHRPERKDGWIGPSMTVFGPDEFEVEVSSLASNARNDMTIAICIGHYLLHYPLAAADRPDVPMRAPRWVREDDEEPLRRAYYEACWFAYALLMPEPAFRQAWEAEEGAESRIASRFRVSTSAVATRAKGLSLVTVEYCQPDVNETDESAHEGPTAS
jgi:predicted transcriptional regulator